MGEHNAVPHGNGQHQILPAGSLEGDRPGVRIENVIDLALCHQITHSVLVYVGHQGADGGGFQQLGAAGGTDVVVDQGDIRNIHRAVAVEIRQGAAAAQGLFHLSEVAAVHPAVAVNVADGKAGVLGAYLELAGELIDFYFIRGEIFVAAALQGYLIFAVVLETEKIHSIIVNFGVPGGA